MQDINIRFKDFPPEKTVEKIRSILKNNGLDVTERWCDSGIENCYSLRLSSNTLFPLGANGKGVSESLARASAYGEFIERIQCGLMLYKYQSITRDPRLNLQSYAPDGKYMSMDELIENGEWMDYIIKTYRGGLTRSKLAKQCRIYAHADDGRIWTIPFYSLFEDKIVYLPAGLVEHIYSANGCCAGNTREEAWIHALSEIMERRSTISMVSRQETAPVIADEVIKQYPTAYSILNTIRKTGDYDIQLLDFSQGSGYPVVATKLVEKNTHSYEINVAADPVFEIAISRTLTEAFQGRRLRGFQAMHNGSILEEMPGIPVAHNVLNQAETGSGLFKAGFFTEDTVVAPTYPAFAHAHEKDNRQLLEDVLAFYKNLGHPVYVRNCSFLGFPSYQLVVPGISEIRGMKLIEPVSEYALGDAVYSVFRNAPAASKDDLLLMLSFYKKIGTAISRNNNFRGLAGLPMNTESNFLLTNITLAYAAYRLNKYPLAISYLKKLERAESVPQEIRVYFHCVSRYISLLNAGVAAAQIKSLLYQFYHSHIVDRLYSLLDRGHTPFEEHLLKCETTHCDKCAYNDQCSYTACVKAFETIGGRYACFKDTLTF